MWQIVQTELSWTEHLFPRVHFLGFIFKKKKLKKKNATLFNFNFHPPSPSLPCRGCYRHSCNDLIGELGGVVRSGQTFHSPLRWLLTESPNSGGVFIFLTESASQQWITWIQFTTGGLSKELDHLLGKLSEVTIGWHYPVLQPAAQSY